MIHEISILIPTYNDNCTNVVKQLHEQAETIGGLKYEILVGDDGSTNQSVLNANSAINSLSNCRYIINSTNRGRAAIRNSLAEMAAFNWLLFIDCEVNCPAGFLQTYLKIPETTEVAYGGVAIGGNPEKWKNNLRYKYERKEEKKHAVDVRLKRPAYSFRTTNFIIRKDIILHHPFCEKIKTYGYEDVLFGKSLMYAGVHIHHIDNPVEMYHYEDNDTYIRKMEEALNTLRTFQNELIGFSPLLGLEQTLNIIKVSSVIRLLFSLISKYLRHNLCSNNPSLLFFKAYKLGFFLSIRS